MNTTDLTPLPDRPNIEQYKKRAKDFAKVYKLGDAAAIQRTEKFHPRKIVKSLADAQLVLAREHGFESWPKFAKYIAGIAKASSPVSKFERAADAIVAGDTARLRSILRDNPELVQTRSPRVHGAMLIHYVGANGFENWRQKTPKNAVEIARILLDAGVDVDALADTYGTGTTLGLVATSVHPKVAGVQIALLELLIDSGASVDGVPGGWNPLVAALHNGRGEAAAYLASRGARMDLEGAAGAGHLDAVKTFFDKRGVLQPPATREQMQLGFLWACEYGRNDVVAYLIDRGASLTDQGNTNLSGLHWAIIGGQTETIRLLLRRGAPLEDRNGYGGTALGAAFWCFYNGDPGTDYAAIIKLLLREGADPDASADLRGEVDKLLSRKPAKAEKAQRELTLEIVLEKPPAGIDFGLQKGSGNNYETVQKQRSGTGNLKFECQVAVKDKDGQADFAGPFVQGVPYARFLYIDIGKYAGQTGTEWARRLKIPLTGISTELAMKSTVLKTRVPGTGPDGGPNCATVKPFAGWR